MVGLIPISAIIFYANVFVGPAQLTAIPDGCEPKYWEYYRHPITRFISRYFHHNPQQVYLFVFLIIVKSKMFDHTGGNHVAYSSKILMNTFLRSDLL